MYLREATGVVVTHERIVAVGLLTQHDLDLLGPTFQHAWPIDEAPCFNGLLRAIDEADRGIWRDRDARRAALTNVPEEHSGG